MFKFYMNVKSGAVGVYEDWYYEDKEGVTVNAVDLLEVVEVKYLNDEWVGI